MTNTTNTTNNETNYIDPIEKFAELSASFGPALALAGDTKSGLEFVKSSLKSSTVYREALREAAAAALDNYMSTWETPENPDTFRNHVLSCGMCTALEVLVVWANMNDTSLDLLLAEHPYLVAENEELEG